MQRHTNDILLSSGLGEVILSISFVSVEFIGRQGLWALLWRMTSCDRKYLNLWHVMNTAVLVK
jgi:hypothetical protein